MINESRRIAELLLQKPDDAAWSQAIKLDNILQKNNPATAIRQARLIRSRLELLDGEGIELCCQ
ncbi:BrxA family protein [Chitinibacter sp. FCG-7]|uniref:BrxA family protein n=1 Tax=Chitinibacter mangrovi TaxID=3153927 RepID=A0AAU7F9H3_9NEIS